MIDMNEESAFWEFCATQNAFIQHQPGTTGITNHYARFTDEGTIGQLSNLGWPRLELNSLPTGQITGDNAFQWDYFSRAVRVITKVEENNFAAKIVAQNSCKKALFDMVQYIMQSQQNGDACQSNIIQAFILTTISYQLIDHATADGTYAGCSMRIQLKAPLSQAAISYSPFIYP